MATSFRSLGAAAAFWPLFLPERFRNGHRPRLRTEDRVGRTQRQSASYREHIFRLEDSGRSAKWVKLMLRQCEEVLELHLSMDAKLDGAAITVCEVAAPRWRAAFQADRPRCVSQLTFNSPPDDPPASIGRCNQFVGEVRTMRALFRG
jgi:hypothetical protein